MTSPGATTLWDPALVTETDAEVAAAVSIVRRPATGSHGTGWLVSPRHVVTNAHVVADAEAHEIFVEFPDGQQRLGLQIDRDKGVDLATVHVADCDNRVPLKLDISPVRLGTQMHTWGHPSPYAGPAPLLIIGHLAGVSNRPRDGAHERRLILNAAFNPGNSGGPVTVAGSRAVAGVVVAKAVVVPSHLDAAITAMANQKGITLSYPVPLPDGSTRRMIEAEIVAESLQHFFKMTQLVLGEAIMARDVALFLDRHGIPWSAP